jgi:hypothetical protein
MTQFSSGNRISRRIVLIGAGAAAGAALFSREAHAALSVDALLGAYKHAGGDKERQALSAAIEDVVGRMSSLVREVARERLKAANPIPQSLTLAADKKSFMIAYGEELFAAPLDGTAVNVRASTGEQMALKIQLTESSLNQLFSCEDKARENRLQLAGNKLVIDVKVRAVQLPKPLSYRLTYARA